MVGWLCLGRWWRFDLPSQFPLDLRTNCGNAILLIVLQWVSVYWFSRAGPAASVRIYYEAAVNRDIDLPTTSLPFGVSYFPKEIMHIPRMLVRLVAPSQLDFQKCWLFLLNLSRWTKTIGNVVFESEHESGGHFAAHEKPEALVGDLRKMFGKGGPAYGVVSGKNGYATTWWIPRIQYHVCNVLRKNGELHSRPTIFKRPS